MGSLAELLLAVSLARVEPPAEVRPALTRAIAGMRRLQQPEGNWGQHGLASTALAMLAMMEAGVEATDACITRAAAVVRTDAKAASSVYGLSLAILALDRLGDPADAELINTITRRLAGGQKRDGRWSYVVPMQPGEPAANDGHISSDAGEGDNSNTQFALLALWVGRRSGADVEAVLKSASDNHRRSTITVPNGLAWGYRVSDPAPNCARTCCGLLAILMNVGSQVERRLKSPEAPPSDGPKPDRKPPADPLKDPVVQLAFRYAAREHLAECSKPALPNALPDFYALWAFERAAVAYGVTNIHGLDWYRVGIRRILPFQDADGLWNNQYGHVVDTSFAMLFLSKSNLTKDLNSLVNPGKKSELKTEGAGELPEGTATPEELIRKFLAAGATDRKTMLEQYRDAKGAAHTEALATLIARTDADWPKAIRNALAERLARMTAETIRGCLKDKSEEIRRAAAVACAIKEDRAMIPDLVATIDDPADWVVRACGVALARLTGEDFGPPPNATADERVKAIAAWKAWWSKQPK